MRFPADRLAAIRRGRVSVALRPFQGRLSGFRVGHYFSIERVDDVRHERYQLGDNGLPIKTLPTIVTYEREVTKLEEWIHITARERGVLDELGDDVARAAGYADLEQLVDGFRADFGGPSYQRVWIFDFVYAEGIHRLEGLPDEPESPDPATLEHYAAQNRTFDELREQRRREKYAKRTLRERAEVEEVARELGLTRQLARAHAAMDALEREVRKRRAA